MRLGLIAASALAAVAAKHGIRAAHGARDNASGRLFVDTPDGWELTLSHYRPQTARRRRHPVLLIPGLASNRFAFDLRADVSLALALAKEGFSTYTLELRGHGLSERPSWLSDKRWGWTFDTYLERDLPAALDALCEVERVPAAHVIGHSMGGILLYARLASSSSPRVRSGVAIAAALDYSVADSAFHNIRALAPVARALPRVPLETLAVLGSPLAGRADTPIDRLNIVETNVDPALFRRLNAVGVEDISGPVLEQLASAFVPGGLRPAAGGAPYLSTLSRARAPVLALCGDQDAQCHPDAARACVEALGGPHRFVPLGLSSGQLNHYGHFDPLIGKRVHTEVFPAIVSWLDAHDDGHPGGEHA